MEVNNFQQLYRDAERRFDEQDKERILHNIWSNLGFLRMIGDLADVYLSKAFDVLVDAAGRTAELPPDGPFPDITDAPSGPQLVPDTDE